MDKGVSERGSVSGIFYKEILIGLSYEKNRHCIKVLLTTQTQRTRSEFLGAFAPLW
jgi:hypothetical protein